MTTHPGEMGGRPRGDTTRWVSEHDVVSVLSLADALEALRVGFALEGSGQATELEKTTLGYGDHATLHALGAAFAGFELVGVKTWTHTPGGADPVLCMFNSRTGSLIACIEAFALGQLRTSGTAALATDLLARPDASVLAVIGTGKQALPQVAAVAQVRPLTEVRAYSRSPEGREVFASKVTEALGVQCCSASSVEAAVDGADIVTLVTRATEPVLLEGAVAPGVHVNAVGAIDLNRREFEPVILSRCATVVTDSLAQAKRLSSELRAFYGLDDDGRDGGAWQTVRPLGSIVVDGTLPRATEDVTLFKGMGSGIEDVALGAAVLQRLGIGSVSPTATDVIRGAESPRDSIQTVSRRGRADAPIRPRSLAQQ